MSAKRSPRSGKPQPAIIAAAEAAPAPVAETVPEEIVAAPDTAVSAALAAADVDVAEITIEMNQIEERITEMQTETTTQTFSAAAQTANEAAQTITDRTQAMFGDVNARAKQSVERSTKIVEEMTDLTRGNVEALVASSKVAARGFETIAQDVAEFGRRSFEEASAAVKTFAEVRSATDLFRLQGDYARTAFDNMVAESSKMSESMIKLAGEVAEPITSRYSVAAERVKNIAA
jgi:phasin family protein